MKEILMSIVLTLSMVLPGLAQYGSYYPEMEQQVPAPPRTGAGPVSGMQDMQQMMQMMGMMHPAITVDESFVYVIRGSELLKLDKNTLQIISRTTLPPAQMPAMGGGAGRGPAVTDMTRMSDMLALLIQVPDYQFDRTFPQQMINHNSMAISFSMLAVQKALHPELQQFAQRFINEKSLENYRYATYLAAWYNTAVVPMPDMQIAAELRMMQGKDFEIAYMQHMIMHLSESLEAEQLAMERGVRSDLSKTASAGAASDLVSLQQLRTWLSQWYGVNP